VKDVEDMKVYLAAFDQKARELAAAGATTEAIVAELKKTLPPPKPRGVDDRGQREGEVRGEVRLPPSPPRSLTAEPRNGRVARPDPLCGSGAPLRRQRANRPLGGDLLCSWLTPAARR
jgi:anti-sigma factor RsiW